MGPGWLGLERAAHAVVVRPTLAVAEALARFDDRVLDGAVDDLARARCARPAGPPATTTGGSTAPSRALAARMRALGRFAQRPQTGQLHQYYLQAIAVIAFGVLLLVTVR